MTPTKGNVIYTYRPFIKFSVFSFVLSYYSRVSNIQDRVIPYKGWGYVYKQALEHTIGSDFMKMKRFDVKGVPVRGYVTGMGEYALGGLNNVCERV